MPADEDQVICVIGQRMLERDFAGFYNSTVHFYQRCAFSHFKDEEMLLDASIPTTLSGKCPRLPTSELRASTPVSVAICCQALFSMRMLHVV